MAKINAYLCIGGPYDGQRIAVNDNKTFVAHTLKSIEYTWYKENVPIPSSNVERIMYVADRIHTGKDGEYWFWRPADQSFDDSMKLLFQRYEQVSNINWFNEPWS